MPFRRECVEDCRPTSAKHPSNRKRKKLDKVKANFDCDKAVQHPRQRKCKRKRTIEADPHSYRIPQSRVVI
ncbi:hypothetical protein RHMOL_Rhmol06G0144500 [Rhododendron molle]|uniref:Uncharacterized protein n=1 Tax=Rhododendron molle TaxID=49168 RepID=A0ACC0NDN7_RHOML|nr:hypothetical protein RHMOL_Rhmol06G0144500 [Rhododendron molle]